MLSRGKDGMLCTSAAATPCGAPLLVPCGLAFRDEKTLPCSHASARYDGRSSQKPALISRVIATVHQQGPKGLMSSRRDVWPPGVNIDPTISTTGIGGNRIRVHREGYLIGPGVAPEHGEGEQTLVR